jgi:hypothetical protein
MEGGRLARRTQQRAIAGDVAPTHGCSQTSSIAQEHAVILRPYYYDDSPDSVCLLVTDLKRGADPWFVLTGDTLFVGAVGRPDLHGHARENAAQLYASLHEKVLSLPGDLEIYPGHFSGSVCGVGLSGKPTSTLAFERRWNPMLGLDRQAFVDALADVPPKPAEMALILAFNQGHGDARAGV